jgi:stage V sporulation protein S
MDNETLLKVKGSSSAPSLAAVIAHGVYENKKLVLRAIGASAVNQAMKAVAIAQSYVGAKGLRLLVIPGFTDVQMDDGTVTALVFRIRIE